MEKYIPVNINKKKVEVAMSLSDKDDFRIMNILRDKEIHFKMLKESVN